MWMVGRACDPISPPGAPDQLGLVRCSSPLVDPWPAHRLATDMCRRHKDGCHDAESAQNRQPKHVDRAESIVERDRHCAPSIRREDRVGESPGTIATSEQRLHVRVDERRRRGQGGGPFLAKRVVAQHQVAIGRSQLRHAGSGIRVPPAVAAQAELRRCSST